MTLEDVKAKVQAAYVKAYGNPSVHVCGSPHIQDLFRDVKLYGRDAGADFATTHIERIVTAAVGAAECRQSQLAMPVHGFGVTAVDGMVATLKKLTALEVEADRWNVTVTWAKPGLGLV